MAEPLRNFEERPSRFSKLNQPRSIRDITPEYRTRLITQEKRASIVAASLWMIGLTLALFFLPLINGLIGGLVGGYKTGSVKRAMMAAVLPAVVVTLGLWLLLGLMGLPVVGAIAGLAVGGVILLSDVGIFVGALIGGAMKQGAARS